MCWVVQGGIMKTPRLDGFVMLPVYAMRPIDSDARN
jgi:hypothetical protein